MAEELELAGSELITNALLHTRSGFEVTIAVCSGVRGAGRTRPRPPRTRAASAAARPAGRCGQPCRRHRACERRSRSVRISADRHPSLHVGPSGSIAAGRGLLIVDAIADEWGVASHAGGKDVWLRMPLPRTVASSARMHVRRAGRPHSVRSPGSASARHVGRRHRTSRLALSSCQRLARFLRASGGDRNSATRLGHSNTSASLVAIISSESGSSSCRSIRHRDRVHPIAGPGEDQARHRQRGQRFLVGQVGDGGALERADGAARLAQELIHARRR